MSDATSHRAAPPVEESEGEEEYWSDDSVIGSDRSAYDYDSFGNYQGLSEDGADDSEEDEEDEEGSEEDHSSLVELTPEPEIELHALPDRLVPPTEILTKIIHCLGLKRPATAAVEGRTWLWQCGRLVCAAWRDLIEEQAKKVWLLEAVLSKQGQMVYTDDGKLLLSVTFKFDSLDGDLIKFKENDWDARHLRTIKSFVRGIRVFDCFLGGILHDLRLKGLKKDLSARR